MAIAVFFILLLPTIFLRHKLRWLMFELMRKKGEGVPIEPEERKRLDKYINIILIDSILFLIYSARMYFTATVANSNLIALLAAGIGIVFGILGIWNKRKLADL